MDLPEQRIYAHCTATFPAPGPIDLTALSALASPGGRVRPVDPASLAGMDLVCERYEFVCWIEADHFDRAWVGRLIAPDGTLVGLVPGAVLDWRGAFRHAGTESSLERAIAVGAARLLRTETIRVPVPAVAA